MRAMKFMLVASTLVAGGALAADASYEAAKRCVQVKDSLERLVCFDRAFAGVPGTAGVVTAPATAPVAPAPSPAPARAPSVAAAPPAAVPAPVAPALGDESVRSRATDREDSAPTSLTASVSNLREMRPGVFRVSLDNGQVWQQKEMDSLFIVREGDQVEVQRGRLGGYRMGLAGGKTSGWVRVERIK